MAKLLVILMLLLSCGNIFSQDAAEALDTLLHEQQLNEIEIVAFKQNANLSLQPVSASVISAAAVKENNLLNIKEISASVPNLFIPDYGSKMTSPVYIRGIGAAKNEPSVGLYVDGVPYFDRSTFDFNINDIERIEILRGPQGTIYGRNTMGGIINVFTKSPLKYKGTDVRLSAGNYSAYQTGVSHYGRTDGESLGYSFSGDYIHSGGYFRNTFTGKQADPVDAASGRIRLDWSIRPRLTAHLILAYEYSDQDGYPYSVYDTETGIARDIDYNARSFYRRKMSSNGLNVEYMNDYFRLGSQTSFQYYDGVQGLDQDFSSEDLYYVDFYHRRRMFSQEFNIRSLKEESRYKWQLGLFGFSQDYTQTNDVDYRREERHAIQDVHNPTEGFAVYHQSTFNDLLTKGLSVYLGVRYDFEKTRNSLLRTATGKDRTPVAAPEEKAEASFSQILPKASLQYDFGDCPTGDRHLVYVTVAKGYKTGGFNTTAESENDRTFDPEHSWCYEMGMKNNFYNGFFLWDVSFFFINWNNQQISQTKPSGQGFLIRNAGKTESQGVEMSCRLNLSKDLNLQASYGSAHAKYLTYRESETTNYDGNCLPMVPEYTASVSANGSINTNRFLLDKIVLNGQYSEVGKLYWNDANDIYQPKYHLFNGKISFVRDRFSIDLWAKNIGNKKYIAYYFTSMGANYVQKGKPFACGVSLNVGF